MIQKLVQSTIVFTLAFAASCASTPAASTAPADKPATEVAASTPAPKAAESAKPVETPKPVVAEATSAAPAAPACKGYVKMVTSKGDIVIELDGEKAPISTANFLAYVNKGQYDKTIFHRVIKDFMVQGGGFDLTLTEKSTGAPIVNEGTNGLCNARGTIAMARTNDPNSATSQFYINVVNNTMLDSRPGRPGYAVFGKVIDGMQVVDAIRAVPTGRKMATTRGGQSKMGDVPTDTVEITSIVQIAAPSGGAAAPTSAAVPAATKPGM